jgi:hypothetical protein
MKKHIILIIISVQSLVVNFSKAQSINWANLKEENKHIINANVGVEYGTVYGVGYSYQVKNSLFPVLANIDYSFPSGNNIVDDFKTKVGGQIRWVEYNHFQFSTKIHGVFRRYENDYARLLNFGSDFSGIVGYYRSRWFVAGEFGFDKAIVTHFKHSDSYRDQYAGAVNGWYQPATGGNFYWGLQGGISFKKNDVYVRAGKTISQDLKTKPMIPFYLEVGCNIKL